MAHLKISSFVTGFVCAMLVVAAYFAWQSAEVIGGIHSDSPDGAYSLHAMAPASPTDGGSYKIELRDQSSNQLIRSVILEVPASEQTVALRDGGGSVQWDAASEFVDLQFGGKPAFRIWIP